MSILKFIIVGAAVGYGISYITKKNENGRSIIEDLADNAPDWFLSLSQRYWSRPVNTRRFF